MYKQLARVLFLSQDTVIYTANYIHRHSMWGLENIHWQQRRSSPYGRVGQLPHLPSARSP